MHQTITDSCCDLPYHVLAEERVNLLSVNLQLNDQELVDDLGKTFNYDHYMNQPKNDAMPAVSQVNAGRYLEFFRSYAGKQIPVLYVAFSSGLSSSYSSALQAVELLKEKYEDPEIYIFDMKATSIGEGLLVLEAARLEKKRRSIEETLEWLEKNYLKVHSWVIVDDLEYLERGDKISKTSAILGSLLNIKPVITVDKEERLTDVDRVRGRNKSIQTIVNETVKAIVAPPDQIVHVTYAGDLESTGKVKRLLKEQIKMEDAKLYPLGPTITSHAGYGCITIFSMGISR